MISTVSPLPPQWVSRSGLSEKIIDEIIREPDTNGVVRIGALHGLGGVGKSTLARALCFEQRISDRFIDGILWGDVGQQPDPLSILNRWITALGDSTRELSSIDEASDRLSALLAGRKVLLVLDDVWDSKHVRPLLVHHAGYILLTTRRAIVADELGASLYDIPVMSANESMELVRNWLQKPIEHDEIDQVRGFVTAVEYLPLAISLAAPLTRRGLSWSEICSRFLAVRSEIGGNTPNISRQLLAIRSCIAVSMNVLRQEDPLLYSRFIKLGLLAEGASVDDVMCSLLWRVSAVGAHSCLCDLMADALLQRVGETFRIHTFVHDVTRQALVRESPVAAAQYLSQLHREFVSGIGTGHDAIRMLSDYRSDYLLEHFMWHLSEAEMPCEVHRLLSVTTEAGENAWQVLLGSCSMSLLFHQHINFAIRLASKEFNPFPLLVRYSLMQSSLNTHYISPVVLEALVVCKRWSAARALAFARNLRSSSGKVDGLTRLWCSLRISSPELARRAEVEAAELLPYVEDRHSRLKFASRLIQSDDQVIRENVLSVVLKELASTDERNFAGVRLFLAALPESAEEMILRRVTSFLRQAGRLADCSRSLTRGVQYLPAAKRTRWVRVLSDEFSAALPTARAGAETLLSTALDTLSESIDRDTEARVIEQISLAISSTLTRERMLASREERLRHILSVIERSDNLETRIERLCDMRNALEGQLRVIAHDIAKGAIGKIIATGNGTLATKMLSEVSWLLTDDSQAAIAAQIMRDGTLNDSGWAHAYLASKLTGDMRSEAINRAVERLQSVRRDDNSDLAMAALIKVLEVGKQENLLSKYQSIGDVEAQVGIKFCLAPYLGDACIDEILRTSDVSDRVKVIAKMLGTFVGVLLPEQLYPFAKIASQLVSEWWLVEELGDLLLQMKTPDVVEKVINISGLLSHADMRSRLVTLAATRLSDLGYTEAAGSAAQGIALESSRLRGLCEIAIRLAQQRHFEASRQMLVMIDDQEERGRAQAHLILFMGEAGLVEEARSEVDKIESLKWRRWAAERIQAELGPGLSPTRVFLDVTLPADPTNASEDRVFKLIMGRVSHQDMSDVAWADLIKRFEGGRDTSQDLRTFWTSTYGGQTLLDCLANLPRPELLGELCLLVPLIARYGDADDLRGLESALQDVVKWWP